jgi:diguanylate cyclase (GGDEF)-like protein/PAS domain S-box-containing protein
MPFLRRRAALWQLYLAAGGTGVSLYLFVSPFKGSGPLLNCVGLSAVVAVVAGIRRNRPSYALPWWLFALGLALYWMGDVYTYSFPQVLHVQVPFPSVGDAVYLAVYPVLMVGLALLVRRRNPDGDQGSLIDAGIMTLGLAVLSWTLLIAPYLNDPSLGLAAKLVSVAYPVGDILLLAAAIRLALDRGKHQPAFRLLTASLVSLLVTDFVYGVLTLHRAYHHQLALDLGWMTYQLLWGAAALHPSMVVLQEPPAKRESALTAQRGVLLIGASLIAPGCLLLTELRRGNLTLIVIVVASLVLSGFVFMRMVDLVRRHQRAVSRERLLAQEGARLTEEVHRQRNEARFASLVARASDLITVVDASGSITYQSPSCERILGYAPDELLGTRFQDLAPEPQAEELAHMLAEVATDGRVEGEIAECVLRRRDGERRQFEIVHTNLLADQEVRGIVLNARDVSERNELARRASHDQLTGLPNRALFLERLRQAIARTQRTGDRLAILFLDLDNFKRVNDTHGHSMGDAVLIEVARRLTDTIRASDTPARFGGDEFVVLLEDLDSAAGASEVAERILDRLSTPLLASGSQLTMDASIGISILDERSGLGAAELLRSADAAMYAAKRNHDGYKLFDLGTLSDSHNTRGGPPLRVTAD